MLKKDLCSIIKLYAISPVHAGSGAATSAIDLPIQRERHTQWPQIQASGVKGAFRDHFRKFNGADHGLINLIFGSDADNDKWNKEWGMLPAAVSISDARVLAFPVRSNKAPFVWVTCPGVLKRLNTDLAYTGMGERAIAESVTQDSAISIGADKIEGQVILEDAVVNVTAHRRDSCLKALGPELEKLLLVSDEMFKYIVTCCTEIQAHIKIDEEKGTADDGALWYQEYLPADSLLYTLLHFSQQHSGEIESEDIKSQVAALKASTIKGHLEKSISDFIQIGGDETLGKGIFKISWISGGDL